jgi:hypothetical protein
MTTGEGGVWGRQLAGRRGDLSRRAGVLFMIGSTCFALGSFPPYFDNLPAEVVAVTFFIGSIFFISAGITQLAQVTGESGSRRWIKTDDMIWWATVVQFVGMLFFNINTYRAAFLQVSSAEVNHLIWAPDFFGSIAFLVASHLAWWALCRRWWCVRRDDADWWIAALNYVGSIFFMVSAIGAYTIPATDSVIDIVWVNVGTFLGAVGFWLGGYLLLPAKARPTAV